MSDTWTTANMADGKEKEDEAVQEAAESGMTGMEADSESDGIPDAAANPCRHFFIREVLFRLSSFSRTVAEAATSNESTVRAEKGKRRCQEFRHLTAPGSTQGP